MARLLTPRLILRPWRDSDRGPFAKINSDPRVMEYFPHVLARAESDAFVDQITMHFAEHRFGLYAAELAADRSFIGYIGLAVPKFTAAFTPCVEIGWRLAADHWGKGLASEGAREIVRFAFATAGLDSLVSFTVPGNRRSRHVMEKIGMMRDPAEDFDHPALPAGHPLQRHVLYRLHKADWEMRG